VVNAALGASINQILYSPRHNPASSQVEAEPVLSLMMIGLCHAATALAPCAPFDDRWDGFGVSQMMYQLPVMAPPPTNLVISLKLPPARSNEIHRAADGLFYVDALVNGAPVHFMVDTGASVVVLKLDDARRAGIEPAAAQFSSNAETANGQAEMARVTIDQVVVGENRSEAIDAAVVRENLPVSLLGQTWLAKLGSMTITGDRMVFNPPSS
jgi:clan AA aspartic protease (TIGR02281 family)